MLNSSNHLPQQQHRLQPLRQLLHDHPIACCSGLWAVLLIGGSVAILGLLNPGPIEKGAYKPTPGLTTFQESTPKPKHDLPLSLFGILILGCGAGSLIVTQALKYSTCRQPSSRMKPNGSVKKRRRPSNNHRTVSKTPQQTSSALVVKARDNRLATINNQRTHVTVLPPEESHPLDGGDENLAEMLDLRKRYSLSSLMRGK